MPDISNQETAVADAAPRVWQAGDEYPLRHRLELKSVDGSVIEAITHLTLRRLTGADLTAVANAASKGQGEALKVIVCRACSIPPATYDRLDAQDLTEVSQVAAGFMGSALPIGGM
ncbi:MAG: hypothetical protein A3E25_17880 [Burkholderiales bacterium RIFCSPHIGHO2_12_FULL_69_20]|nr:MAG: hypothetical protein A3E25_17880 [Burkholderiales bacterium RIFCSPHIGHO2_12_FULL_69_20]